MVYLILVTLLLSCFSTAVMSYISMATAIGPWISPTLVLCAYILFKIALQQIRTESMIWVVAAGSVGGIVATAVGFSFPALYFLDQSLFNSMLAQPFYFALFIGVLVLVSGWFGIWIANLLEQRMLADTHLPFPTGQLVYKMIAAGNQYKQSLQLLVGALLFVTHAVLQGDIGQLPRLLPSSFSLLSARSLGIIALPSIVLDMTIVPMLLAIGFVTGHVIALPLLVGAVGKIILLDPLHTFWFAHITSTEFSLAFCSGMVLIGAVSSMFYLPKTIYRIIKDIKLKKWSDFEKESLVFTRRYIIELVLILILFSFCAWYLQCSALVGLYLLVTTYLCVYNMVYIGAKTGLAYLGRFATFVMVPAMLLFPLNYTQLICIATFVEIAGGVAVDILCNRKTAQLADVPMKNIIRAQYIGLCLTSLSIGMIFWLLVTTLQLGSPALCAYKAQARQLLIHVGHFNYYVLIVGMMCGWLLSKMRINPGMVLGGILMPLNVSLGLIIGGLVALLVRQKEYWYPFWSGIFAANSIWMLLRAFLT